MNREIKFRLYGDGKMFEPFTLNNDFDCIAGWMQDRILMQYTGLKDKNRKEIYEGDIVKTGTDKLMVINWSERFASFCINRDGWAFQHWFGEAFESTDCEVMGNIYTTPELLK
jgi:uncharacterized phage protein (TIGR01671 family)